MKQRSKIWLGVAIGVVAVFCVLSPVQARSRYCFSFGFGYGGYWPGYCYRPYYYYCPPPVYYYVPPPVYYYPPPPPPVTYYAPAPLYYYSGGVIYRY